MDRNFRVSCQCAAKAASVASGSLAARSTSARSASSISAASSTASRHAASAVRGAPPAPPIARISRDNCARREAGSTDGGMSSAPANASGASSNAPRATMRGSNNGLPPVTRRNASASERADRRVGSSSRPCAVRSGSFSVRRSQPDAMASRKLTSGGMENRFIVRAAQLPPPRGPAGWRGETIARHARWRAIARLPAHGPRPGSC